MIIEVRCTADAHSLADAIIADFEELQALVGRRRTARHKDGIAWYQAPRPRRLHRCWVQTRGVIDGRGVHRCPCGAVRTGESGWQERNSRRRKT